jgi:hypothetical protein
VTLQDAVQLLQQGGVLVAALFAIWALLTGKVVTRREFDALQARLDASAKREQAASDELIKQSATNAKLVELSFQQRREAERIRREPEGRTEAQYDEDIRQ